MKWLHSGPLATGCPKIDRLSTLASHGLNVPRGVVLLCGARVDTTLEQALDNLRSSAGSPYRPALIVRMALAEEDGEESSAAGLGLSIPNCHSADDVDEALQRIAAHAHDPSLHDYWPHHTGALDYRVLIQAQVDGPALVVATWAPDIGQFAEVYPADQDALAQGVRPEFSGPLASWSHAAAQSLTDQLDAITSVFPGVAVEAEFVVDDHDRVHVVQARPLTRSLVPGWPEFLAQAQRVRSIASLDPVGELDGGYGDDWASVSQGRWQLDAEHNPAPVSPAHAWLLAVLREQRPHAGEPRVIAGWLYMRALPRQLHARPDRSPRAALQSLADHHLPAARARCEQTHERCRQSILDELPSRIEEALAAFLDMIDVYLGELARSRGPRHAAAENDAVRLTLHDRERFADVLPIEWDVASPSIAEVVALEPSPRTDQWIPDDEGTAAILLAEWDDHLFALGLEPLRAVYRWANKKLRLSDDDAFYLSGDELIACATAGEVPGPTRQLIAARRSARLAFASLRPPLVLWDGRPVPVPPSGDLVGLPIGPSVDGQVVQVADLRDLAQADLPERAVVCVPALTAQAALVLARREVAAVCTEFGGALSHAAIMVRELGLSALIGCTKCTTLPAGTNVRVDTQRGRLLRRYRDVHE